MCLLALNAWTKTANALVNSWNQSIACMTTFNPVLDNKLALLQTLLAAHHSKDWYRLPTVSQASIVQKSLKEHHAKEIWNAFRICVLRASALLRLNSSQLRREETWLLTTMIASPALLTMTIGTTKQHNVITILQLLYHHMQANLTNVLHLHSIQQVEFRAKVMSV